MKRKGNFKIYWASYEALFDAWNEVKQSKSSHYPILKYEQNLAVNLDNLSSRLKNNTYSPKPLRSFYVFEPKKRLIEAPDVEDRIVQHALLNIIRPIIEKRFISQTYACRRFKGTHNCSDQLKNYLIGYKNSGYCLKLDIHKFFYSIDHSILETQLKKIIKCKETLRLLKMFYDNDATVGLPLGNVTSQILANLALNDVDHYIKRELKIKHYIRYMDDMILLSDSKEKLKTALSLINTKINEQRLLLNNKTKISKISEGVDFVGYRTWYNRRLIRKRTLYRVKRKLKIKMNLNRVSSYLSHSMRTNSLIYVIRQILSIDPEMRPWIANWYQCHFKNNNSQ